MVPSKEALTQHFSGRKIPFYKYEGCGNNFIVVDETDRDVFASDEDRFLFAALYCDSKFGVGADEVLYVQKSEIRNSDGRMRVVESLGTESNMCGNGIRGVADMLSRKYDKKDVRIETGTTKRVLRNVKRVGDYANGGIYEVMMGSLITDPSNIASCVPNLKSPVEIAMNDLQAQLHITAADIEPHAFIFVDDIELGSFSGRYKDRHISVGGRTLGESEIYDLTDPIKEDEKLFRQKGSSETQSSVSLLEVCNKGGKNAPAYLKIITNERGFGRRNGITLACGTAATAGAGLARLFGDVKSDKVTVESAGGVLTIDTSVLERMKMSGPVRKVFEGTTF